MRWTSYVYRQTVRKLGKASRRRVRLRIESLETREVPTVSGTVFIDFNLDGVQDAEDVGAAGVSVTATDDTGAAETTQTAIDGTYTLATNADNLRIEFADFPVGTQPGRVAGTSGPTVRFLDASSPRDTVDLALASPLLITSQFYYDHAIDGPNSGQVAVMALPYGDESGAIPTPLALFGEVGSVWGLAYQSSSNSVYASSFVKRHAGLGPNAAGTDTTAGGIYRINRAVDPVEVTMLIDLNTTAFSAGVDPHDGVSEIDGGDWFHDTATLPLVGKRGLGGLQISPDGRTLYVVNLNSRELIEIGLNADGTRDTGRALRGTQIPLTIPAGSGITSFNAANLRPFAVAVKDNAVFVGVTYTSEFLPGGGTPGNVSDLRAIVYAFDPAQGAFRSYNQTTGTFATSGAAAPVLIADLTYARGVADDPDLGTAGDEILATWQPWTAGFDTSVGQEGVPIHPEPWLTDIVFDGDVMILGLRDRAGDQGGFQTGNATLGDDTTFTPIAVGDILRAAPNGSGGWQVEANATSGSVSTSGAGNTQGPGNGEFYFEDNVDPFPQDVVTGGLAQAPGLSSVAATGNDPISSFAGGIYTFANSDTDAGAANTAGTALTRTELYISDTLDTFGSANGLGDLEALAANGTVQVGDRIFTDSTVNGIQDAGEAGIAGVVVRLFQAGAEVDSVTSGSGGDYLFNNLLANTNYEIRIDTTQAALSGRVLAAANQGSNDELDSDATLNGTTAVIAFTTGAEGTTNTSLDVGFATLTLTLGNRVWRDETNDGLFNPGDVGVAGVLVELLDDQGNPISGQTTTTNANGLYTFTGLQPNGYRVQLAASNFATGGVLAGFTSSASSGSNPNDDADNDDNGIVNGALGTTGVIRSEVITLAFNSEPDNDTDSDTNTNLTLDFGVVPPPAGPLTIGNLVFRDVNNNGTFDGTDAGIDGVVVELLDNTGAFIPGKTTTTSGGGFYSFSSLATNTYAVRLAASNFNTGGILFGFTSSTFTSNTPDDNQDNNDDGAPSGSLGGAGFIVSGQMSLTADQEPITDGDADPNTNMTLDFGVVPPSVTTVSLGSHIFNDANNNGLFDATESGIAGVTVQLVNPTGTIVQTKVTDAAGLYTFTNVTPADYRVRIASSNFTGTGPLVGFTSSTGTNGSTTGAFEAPPDPDTNTTNNDDNGQNVGVLGQASGAIETPLVTLALNTEPTNDGDADANTNLSVDLGVFRKFTLGNVVFRDLDNDGTQDANEPGIANVSVRLRNADLNNELVATVTTNAQGQYLFSHLAPVNYIVELAATNFNAGGALFSYSSSTGASNAFEPAPAGATDKQDHGTTIGTLGSGGVIQSGTITLGPGATAPTGESPNNDTTGTPDNQSNLTVDFGVFQQTPANASIAGRVFLDYNDSGTFNGPDAGIQGVTLTLSGGTLTTPLTLQTDAQGNFTFTNLAAGTYTIVETQPTTPNNVNGKHAAGSAGGNIAVANTISNIVLATGENATNYRFAEVPLLTTGGAVYEDKNGNGIKDLGEPGIPDVTITLAGNSVVNGAIAPQTTTTNAEGNYSFIDLTPGTYSLTETQPTGFIDGDEQNGTPAAVVSNDKFSSINLTSTAAVSTGFNFGEVKSGSIAGIVFNDVDDNGTQAATGEDGIANVTIKLTGTNDLGQSVSKTTTTGTNGAYAFADLRPGTYKLVETQPKGYADGRDTAGTSGGNASAVNDQISDIALPSGASATGYFFGEHTVADVTITQSPTSATIVPGGLVVITYTVKNKGTAPAAGVSAVIKLGSLQFVIANSPDYNSTTRTWTIGDLAPGASETLRITFRANTAGIFAPTSRVSTTSTELSTTNNAAGSTILAGISTPVVTVAPSPSTWWFLSSSTNAKRTPL